MSNFVSLSTEQLPQLMDEMQTLLPHTLPIFYTADNTTRGRLSLKDVQYYVDVWPDPSCIVLISPAHSGQLFNYRTTVDLWAKNSDLVHQFLRDTATLDWTQPIFFRVPHVDKDELTSLQSVLERNGGNVTYVERHIYTLSEAPVAEMSSLPKGYTLPKELDQKDAETVGRQYSAWGVKPTDTIRYFQACAAHLPSSSIHTDDGELVSYVALHHTSAFGSVVTDLKHQRKGLGTVVVSDVCQRMKVDGQLPYVYVNPENTASAKLYEKCGFRRAASAYRIRYVPGKQ